MHHRRFQPPALATALAALAFASAFAVALPADAKISNASSQSVRFNASGPAGLAIVGTTNELFVGDDGKLTTITVPLRGLTTGISLRDKHMREKYLEVGTYPNAELKVSDDQLKSPTSGDTAGDVAGTMSIHGKSKPVTFHYSAKRAGSKIHVEGSVKLNITDFGINVPSYLGVTVKPDIVVEAKFDVDETPN